MTGPLAQAKLWYWQRLSAMALALFVLVHLATMAYAVRGGLGAAEILGRTRGSWIAGGFYCLFVLASMVHAGIGLAGIAQEWLGAGERTARALGLGFAIVAGALGLGAVYGVVVP